jgi:uncharacterized protein (TIGR00255 family)
MILSMTGFGRSSVQIASVQLDIEVKSVNHRHLDTRVRVPRILSSCEADLQARIQSRIGRGKVDMTVTISEGGATPTRLEIDMGVAEQYARVAGELAAVDGVGGVLSVDTLVGLPGVARLVEAELPVDEFVDALNGGVEEALDALVAMRSTEGQVIERDLLSRLEQIEGLTDALEQRSDLVRESVRERLHKRAKQLQLETGLLDEARLQQEVVIAADRSDVTEEIVRLRSHAQQFREILGFEGAGNPVGRRLEFLLQEFGREANTIGAKGSDAPISHEVVSLKTELERIREQVQNVE